MTQTDKLKVFISYSREDLKFADQLDAALDLVGFDCTIDRHGIHGGEDWKERLGNLILEADTVVFVLSPTSAVSKICEWEVEEAARRGKRILPVLCRELDGADPPERLRNLNYVYFYDESKAPGSGFGAGLAQLVAALNTDLDWLREHTRLLERANEWAEGGRKETALLFGSSITEAKQWAERRTKSAPEITPLHLEFIRASEEADVRRQDAEHQRLKAVAAAQEERAKAIAEREAAQKREIEASRTMVRRTRIGLVVLSVLAIAATGVGIYAFLKRGEAIVQTATAEGHLARAAQTSSLFRAAQAASAIDGNDPVTAAVVALSGVPDARSADTFDRTRPFFPEAFHALHRAWRRMSERAVLAGHSGEIVSAAAAPDGTYLVTVSADHSAGLWDSAGKPLKFLSAHRSALTSAAVAPDSSLLAVGSLDLSASIWTRDGVFKARLSGHEAAVTSIAFSPDGKSVLTTSRDRQARLWDLEGKLVARLEGHNGVVFTGAFSPDGTHVLTASEDYTAALWARDGRRIASFEGHTGAVLHAGFSPRGDVVATASEDGTVRLWSLGGAPLATFGLHTQPVTSVAFSADGELVVSGSADSEAAIWNRNGSLVKVLKGHTDAVHSVAFSPDGQRVLTASQDGTARLWDRGGGTVAVMRGHDGAVSTAVFTPDGRQALTASNDRTARLWTLAGREAPLLDEDTASVLFRRGSTEVITRLEDRAVMWSPDGKKLAELVSTGSNAMLAEVDGASSGHILGRYADGQVLVWDRRGAEVARIESAGADLTWARISPDGSRVLTLAEGSARLWDLKGNSLAQLATEEGNGKAHFSSDGARIVIVAESGIIDVWSRDGKKLYRIEDRLNPERIVVSPDGGRALRVFRPEADDPRSLADLVELGSTPNLVKIDDPLSDAAFSSDGSLAFALLRSTGFAILDSSGKILTKGAPALKLSKPLGISPDGSRLLALTAEGQIILLDGRGRPVLTLDDEGPVQEAMLSADGAFAATLASGTARVWPTFPEPQALVELLKVELPRCLDLSRAKGLFLPSAVPTWCRRKYPAARGETVPVAVSMESPDTGKARREIDFAYYPPGDIVHRGDAPVRGRVGDRKVYLPDIAFPLKLGPGEHAYMNSQIWGYGGGGWAGKGTVGGSECDRRNYDAMQQRDTFCEVRGFKNALCPAGTGKQGQSIRPPSCRSDKWDVVAVADGQITLVTSNTTVRLRGQDGTEYDYLHMAPSSIRVKKDQWVKKGEVIGRVGNVMGGRPATTIQLGFSARQVLKIGDVAQKLYVPVYSSLIAAYRELKGLDRGVDSDGNLVVDPDYEIGAGKAGGANPANP